MENASESPLKKYRRQPKVFFDLPSRGQFYTDGVLYGNTYTSLPVFSMTAGDEILFKTPDALVNGEATAANIRSCIPSILQPFKLVTLDIDAILVSIRMATFGPNLGITHSCPHCKSENSYEIPLQKYLDHYNRCEYNDTLVYGSLIIKTAPPTYADFTEVQKKTLSYQRALNINAPKITDEKQRDKYEHDILVEIGKLQVEIIVNAVKSIEVEGVIETNKKEIREFLDNSELELIKALKKHIEDNTMHWQVPLEKVKCANNECGKENLVKVSLDQSDFFDLG